MSRHQMDMERTKSLLVDLGFSFVPERLGELVSTAVQEESSLTSFLETLLRTEHEAREERRIRTGLKLSGLPQGKTLASFDYAFQPGIDRGKVELLSTCEFARRRENILLLGAPGVGKTHLAAALGVRCIQSGFSVFYVGAAELVEQLKRDEEGGTRRMRRRKYMSASVLIIDELGFQALDRRESHLLFRVVSERYEKASTIITSNKGVKDWPAMLAEDEVLTMALLDRLLHHCNVLRIDGRSYRLREMEALLQEG